MSSAADEGAYRFLAGAAEGSASTGEVQPDRPLTPAPVVPESVPGGEAVAFDFPWNVRDKWGRSW